MEERERNNIIDIITMSNKVPKAKQEYILGYMQALIDTNDDAKGAKKCKVKKS